MDLDKTPENNSEKHPPGLYLLFFTEMWERFSYYGLRALLTLYLSKTLMQGGLGFAKADSTIIYGWFTGLVYLTPIIGGYLADKYLGQRKAILIGGITMMLGQFSLAATPLVSSWATSVLGLFSLPPMSELDAWSTWLGLGMIIIGNGFFKPNISTLVGNLYPQGDVRRDSAFTIFYMGINLGALFAPLVCGYFAEDLFAVKGVDKDGKEIITHYAFQYGFLAAGIGMMIGQIIFNTLSQKYLGDIGKFVKKDAKLEAEVPEVPLTKEETSRMAVILTVTIFTILFWAGFEQAGSSLTLYTDSYINRKIEFLNWTIPTSFFQSVNPLFIVLFGSFFASLWLNLGKKGKDLSIPVKMSLGMVLLGIGFFFMIGAVMERGGDSADATIKANLMWLVMTYFFHTIGELCLSPIGLSMVTRLAPIRYASMLMGVWFLAPFVAQIAGGYIAAYVEKLGAFNIFVLISAFVIFAGFVLFLASKKLIKMMHGRG